ncbi:MAG TPA: hypothetical protein VF950_14360 [Planctomycetota bacterium]
MRIALVVLLLPALSEVEGAPQEDIVKKIVSDAEKIKKTAKKLAPASKDKVEKALGEKLDAADLAATIWECYATVPKVSSMDKTLVRALVVTAKGPKGPIKVGVSVASLESTIHTVKILENGDDKAVESSRFLSQFQGFEYTPNVFNGGDVLKAAFAKAGADKELDAAIRMISVMRAMEPVYERLNERLEKKDKAAAEDVAELDKHFDESLRLLANAAFLKASQADKFKTFASGGKQYLADMRALIGGGKFDDAYRKAGELDAQSCSRCHGAYRRAFREARLERQVGNGYFSTQLDIAAPDKASEASYQAVGKAVRKAVLIAAEAK